MSFQRRTGRGAARRLLLGLLVGAAALVLGYWGFLQWTAISAPATPDPPALEPQPDGDRIVLGKSWMARRGRIWELHLRGTPFEMGYAHARLARFFHRRANEHLFAMAEKFVPSSIVRFGLGSLLRWRYRNVADAIPPELKMEIAGLAAGYQPDPHSSSFETYHKLIFFHALHDITQPLTTSPLLGCTGFAASGKASAGGHLIIGRNFDFDGGAIFDEEKAVTFFEPEGGGISFASVGWPGLGGVVTGLNAEGLFISVNAARVEAVAAEGFPVILLARWVLQHAHNITEALDILRSHPVMVGDVLMLGDGKSGEAVVVEIAPGKVAVREANERGLLVAANHFLTDALAGDPGNVEAERTLSTTYRHERMEEILAHHEGAIDPGRALTILRDRAGLGGKPIAPGNRNAIDALIATHAVVVDASEKVLWVTEAPHTLGRAIAFDLKRELSSLTAPPMPPPTDFPEDPYLRDGYSTFVAGKELLLMANALYEAEALEEAADAARRALALIPENPPIHKLLGDIYLQLGQTDIARVHLEAFLAAEPARGDHVEDARAKLEALVPAAPTSAR